MSDFSRDVSNRNAPQNSRLDNLSIVKTGLMLSVILGHSVNFWKGNWFTAVEPAINSTFLIWISDYVNSFHVYAFTLVSGYLFYYLKVEKGKYKSFNNFLKGKFLRLIVPYFFVCIVWVVPVAELFFRYNISEIVKRYILGTNPNQLWFLLMLFWVYIIMWPLTKICDKKPVIGTALISSLYVVGVLGSRIIPNYFFFWTGCEYSLFFLIGFLMRKFDSLIRNKWYIWLCCHLVTFVTCECIGGGVAHSILEILVHILGAIAAFETIGKFANRVNKDDKWFISISNKTMPMYLFHQQIIYFTIIMLNGYINPYMHALINYVFALLISYFISMLFTHNKYLRMLIGEK